MRECDGVSASEANARCQRLRNKNEVISLCLRPFAEHPQERITALERARESLDPLHAHDDDEQHRNYWGFPGNADGMDTAEYPPSSIQF